MTQIYLYGAAKVLPQVTADTHPDLIKSCPEELDEYTTMMLNDLRGKIYRSQIRHLKARR